MLAQMGKQALIMDFLKRMGDPTTQDSYKEMVKLYEQYKTLMTKAAGDKQQKQIDKLIQQLNSDVFKEREQAQQALARQFHAYQQVLKASRESEVLEIKRRAKGIIKLYVEELARTYSLLLVIVNSKAYETNRKYYQEYLKQTGLGVFPDEPFGYIFRQ
jgi:hypothetical protein